MAEGRGVRAFLNGPMGKSVSVLILLAGILIAGVVLYSDLRPSAVVDSVTRPLFIDADNEQSFRQTISPGMTIPVKSPFSGKQTGYPAELCNWTKDGHVASEATPVLMNEWINKPGPTFCPVCSRLVVHHNPGAVEGQAPPPTREQYMENH